MTYISVFNARRMLERRKSLRRKQTETERILWQELRHSKLGAKFKRQYSLGNYVADFYCPEAKLAIELMGSVHSLDRAWVYDAGRVRYLESLGVKTLVFWNGEVEKNLAGVLARISQYLSPTPSPVTGEGKGRGEV